MQHTQLIDDNATLLGATFTDYNTPIPVYDNGFGPIFIVRDSMGVIAFVRAQTLEDAYEICEDEFFPEASETIEDLRRDYGFRVEYRRATDQNGAVTGWERIETADPDAWRENELFCEGFGFRPNGPNKTDVMNHGIYAKDLNGISIERLASDLLLDLRIELQIERN